MSPLEWVLVIVGTLCVIDAMVVAGLWLLARRPVDGTIALHGPARPAGAVRR